MDKDEEKRQRRWIELTGLVKSVRVGGGTLEEFERAMGPLEAFKYTRTELDGMLTFDFEHGFRRLRLERQWRGD